jgi:phenylacetate-CoA ligase
VTTPAGPERLPLDALRARQLDRLNAQLKRARDRSPFWSARLREAGLPERLAHLDPLCGLPCVTKAELAADQAAHPPYGSIVDPEAHFTRLHQTSGTTGVPLVWLDTAESWAWILDCWRQIFRMTGVAAPGGSPPIPRRCGFPFSFGPFLGFWAAFEAASRDGHFCLPLGGLSSAARLEMLRRHRIDLLACTPTYALRLLDEAAHGPHPPPRIDALIVAGEPGGCLAETRRRIEEGFQARVFDHWGMTEIGSLAVEARDDPGHLYLLESECVGEVLDPATQAPAAPGELGELVVTNLGRTSSPLFRYRTGDLVRAGRSPARAGYHLLRLEGGIQGRCDDMLIVRGNNLLPGVLEDVLRGLPGVAEYRVVCTSDRGMTELEVQLEPLPGSTTAATDELVQRAARRLQDRFHFRIDVMAVEPGSLPRFELKSRRFVRVDGPRRAPPDPS